MTSSYRVQLVYLGDTAPSAEETRRLATQFEAPLRVMLARYDHHSARADQWRRDPLSLNPQGRIAVDLDAAPSSDRLQTLHQQTGAAVYLCGVHWPLELTLDPGSTHAGTLQWSGFQKRPDLDRDELRERWLSQHTDVAIACQNTDSYAQHEILAHFGPSLDGIAEETFPIEAAGSVAAFFAAKDDSALLKTNVTRLLESSRRFIDFDTLSVAHFTEQRLH